MTIKQFNPDTPNWFQASVQVDILEDEAELFNFGIGNESKTTQLVPK